MAKIYEALQKADTEASQVARALAEASLVKDQKQPNMARPAASYRRTPMKLSGGVPVFPFDGSDVRAAEQYRMIRTKIVQNARKPRLIAVSSARAGDGKTITSVNIAGALSLDESAPILLVDADFRRPKIASVVGLDPVPGLNEVLSGACDLEDVIVQSEQFPNLFIAVAGKGNRNAAELLQSPRWTALCGVFREKFQFTIVDTPPIAAVADYDLIQATVDGVIVVVRPDHSRRSICLEAIRSVPANKMLGVVLNCVDDWFFWKNRDYYYAEYAS